MTKKLTIAALFLTVFLLLPIEACRSSRRSAEISLKEGVDDTALFAAKACEDMSVPDYKLAAKFYTRAASCGQPYADYKLAQFYQFGRGVSQDESRAAFYYTKAFKDRIGCMAPLPLIPEGLSKTSIKTVLQGAKEGGAREQYYLGVCHQVGLLNFEKSIASAKIYYKAAMQAGSGDAAYNLGSIYLNPANKDQNIERAIECFVRAGLKGNKAALVVLAKLDKQLSESMISPGQIHL